jgi:hypothetical protein
MYSWSKLLWWFSCSSFFWCILILIFILVLLFVSSSFGLLWGYLSLSLSLLFAWHPPCSSGLCISPLLICCFQDPFALMVFIIILSFVAYKTSTLLWWSSYSSFSSLPTKPPCYNIFVLVLFFITYITYAWF